MWQLFSIPGLLGLFLAALPLAATESRMSFLENGVVKLGVDLELGGAITWLSARDGENRVNHFDLGRQVQLSYFSGPVPFATEDQEPAEHWRHLGWNPIQAGDDFGNGSETVDHRNDGREIYVKCVPLQWPLNHVPGECYYEVRFQLEGPVVKAMARMVNARSDKTPYPARLQELPALYANAAYHRVVSYTGHRPHTGEPAQRMESSLTRHPWTFWLGTEQWSALLDEDDEGLGLVTPGRIWFTGGFAGQPGANDSSANDTGYLAGQGLEILDHDIVHEFQFEVVVGSLAQIRAQAATHSTTELPAWFFDHDRQGWHYHDARDSGWPIEGMLEILPDGPDPQLLSPLVFWPAEEAPVVVIEASFPSGGETATLYWRRFGEEGPRTQDYTTFPVPDDGEFHRHVVRLDECPGYRGPMVQLRLDPISLGNPGATVRVRSIALMKEAPVP